jgi:hypothetical protein
LDNTQLEKALAKIAELEAANLAKDKNLQEKDEKIQQLQQPQDNSQLQKMLDDSIKDSKDVQKDLEHKDAVNQLQNNMMKNQQENIQELRADKVELKKRLQDKSQEATVFKEKFEGEHLENLELKQKIQELQVNHLLQIFYDSLKKKCALYL